MDGSVWILGMMVALLLLPVFFLRRNGQKSSSASAGQIVTDLNVIPAPSVAASGRPSGGGTRRMRHRPVTGAASPSSSLVVSEGLSEANVHNEEQDDDVEVADATFYKAKYNKKKHEKKQDKEARRQSEIMSRDNRREKMERQGELRRQKDDEREAEERFKEEAAQELKSREEEAANAEFDKWKEAFSVDNEGTQVADVQEEAQGLINDFVDYIKKHKCVALEDLAGEFNLRTQDCINRVLALEQMGRISGVMDDRGKFIYISPEEMKAVADYIKKLGRVSIAYLARKSNEFINLESNLLPSDLAQDVGTLTSSNVSPISVA